MVQQFRSRYKQYAQPEKARGQLTVRFLWVSSLTRSKELQRIAEKCTRVAEGSTKTTGVPTIPTKWPQLLLNPYTAMRVVHLDHILFPSEIEADSADEIPIAV